MILLVVNYHYVARERPVAPRAIFPVTVADLEAQLRLLGTWLEFVSRDDVIAAARDGHELPERSCLVTWDDGLRCQLELGLPVLRSLGIPALFLVPGRPLAERRALYVHKVHHLRERVADDELLRVFGSRLAGAGFSLDAVPVEEATRHYVYDTPEAAQLKYLLNVALPLPEREALLGNAFADVVGDEGAFCDDLYLSADEVAELERADGAVGAHSYAHEPLALLDPAAVRRDLERSAAALECATGRRPQAVSYPHGSAQAVTPEVAEIAAAAGFVVGFTMERAFNRSLREPLLFGRADANDVPGGSRPLFETPSAGEPVVLPGMAGGRELYFDEVAWLASSS